MTDKIHLRSVEELEAKVRALSEAILIYEAEVERLLNSAAARRTGNAYADTPLMRALQRAERAEAEVARLRLKLDWNVARAKSAEEELEAESAESATHFGWALEMQERAWAAEAEVERLRLTIESLWATEPWQIADELAEALRKIRRDNEPFMYAATDDALARYEEARHGA